MSHDHTVVVHYSFIYVYILLMFLGWCVQLESRMQLDSAHSAGELHAAREYALSWGGGRILADFYISLCTSTHVYILLYVFAFFWYAFVYIFRFFNIKLIVNKQGAPPTH